MARNQGFQHVKRYLMVQMLRKALWRGPDLRFLEQIKPAAGTQTRTRGSGNRGFFGVVVACDQFRRAKVAAMMASTSVPEAAITSATSPGIISAMAAEFIREMMTRSSLVW